MTIACTLTAPAARSRRTRGSRRVASALLPAVIAISAVLHAGAFAAVGRGPRPVSATPSLVELAIAPPAPLPPPAPPPPTPRVVSEPPPARMATRAPRAAPPSRTVPRTVPTAVVPPSAPRQPAPLDFTGTTLTNDQGASWAAAAGTGAPMTGPLPNPTGRPRFRTDTSAAPGRATPHGGPPVVALADLARAPRAPALDAALARHYPEAARQRGIGGKAIVRARIAADGTAHVLGVVSESHAGFGTACRRTLDGARWEAPRDLTGKAVDTVLTYTCRFEVGP